MRNALSARICTITIIFTTFLFPNFSQGQDYIPLLTVTAEKHPVDIKDTGSDISVITSEQIENRGYRTITEAVNSVKGIKVNTNGSFGSISTVRIRGGSSEQVLLLIDGKKYKDATLGLADFNTLPVNIADIERIEILRGASSAIYGADAIGGVVNIITKKDRSTTQVDISKGRHNTKKISISTGSHTEKGGFRFSYSKEKSDGYLKYEGNLDRYDSNTLNFSAHTKLTNNFNLGIDLGSSKKQAASPGPVLQYAPADAMTTTTTNTLGLRLSSENTNLSIFRDKTSSNYHNSAWWINDTTINKPVGIDFTHVIKLSSNNTFVLGGDSKRESTKSPGTGENERNRFGIFAEDRHIFNNFVTASISARYDDIDSENKREEVWSPRASLVLSLSDNLKFKTSAGKGFRIPTVNELSWYSPDYVDTFFCFTAPTCVYKTHGTGDLKSEKSKEYDATLEYRNNNITVALTAFEKKVENLIQWDTTVTTTASITTSETAPVNIGNAKIQGIETEVGYENKYFWFTLGYTYLNPEDEVTGEKLQYHARHDVKNELGFKLNKLTVSFDSNYVDNYTASSDDSWVYFVLNSNVNYKIINKDDYSLSIFMKSRNLLNREYEVVQYYPMKPVSHEIGISSTF